MNPNADQVAYWNGPVAERWTREQQTIDRAFAAFTRKLLDVAALRVGERVLDVGCGYGTSALAAAETVGPTGEVVGVDVSAPLVARAIERSAGGARLSYVLADAAVHRFAESFDVEISRFGVMFFDDPVRAFANLRSALRAGGRLVFACWRPFAENEWARVPYEAATKHVPPDPPAGPEEPGPFSLGDRARVTRVLQGAGFSRFDIVPFDAEVILSEEGVEAAANYVMGIGPTARLIRDASDETKRRVRGTLEATLRPLTQQGRTALDGAAWMVDAVA